MNHILDGLLLGGLYAVSALGLTLVFGVMRVVNLAHGEILVGAAYLAVVLASRSGLDPLLTIVIVAPALFVVCYPLQRFIIGPLLPHGLEGPLVATFGLSIVAQTVYVLGFGGNPRRWITVYADQGTTVAGRPWAYHLCHRADRGRGAAGPDPSRSNSAAVWQGIARRRGGSVGRGEPGH